MRLNSVLKTVLTITLRKYKIYTVHNKTTKYSVSKWFIRIKIIASMRFLCTKQLLYLHDTSKNLDILKCYLLRRKYHSIGNYKFTGYTINMDTIIVEFSLDIHDTASTVTKIFYRLRRILKILMVSSNN